jgi:tetratricopeptide (TPR) repeat protein
MAAVAVCAMSTPALAQGMVQGTVVDAQGQPVEGAKITIEQTETVKRTFQTNTDKKGAFIQIGLQSDTYKITAEKEGVGTATAMTRVTVNTPGVVRLTLSARPAGGDPAAAAKAAELRKVFDEGVAFSRDKKYDDSIAAFHRALEIDPKCADCYYNIGFAYTEQKAYDKAEESYKKALEVEPNYTPAYNGLANIYNAQRRFDEAGEASRKAAELSAAAPGGLVGASADSLYTQAVILWNAGKIAEAKKQLEAALEADSNHAESHYQLGMVLVNEGNLAGAAQEFNTYLKLAPEGANAAQAKALIAQLPK